MKTFSFLFLVAVAVATFGNTDAFQQKRTSRSVNRVKGSSLQMTVLAYKGKKKNFKAGSALKWAVASLGVKPKY